MGVPDARELYLDAWDSFIERGFYYCNEGQWRTTGERGCVDCSGGVYLACELAGAPLPAGCTNSFEQSRLCHETPRPQWMIDKYGPGVGTSLTLEQANNEPGAWAFHGPNEGQEYGQVGHIKSKYWISRPGNPHAGPNVSVEAMSHALDLRYANFPDPQVTFCALPPTMLDCFAPHAAEEEPEVMIVACTNKKPNRQGEKPYAQLVLPNPVFPNGVVLCHFGASIAGDQPTKDPNVRTWFPSALKGKLVAICERADRKGVMVMDDTGATTRGDGGRWS